MGLGRKWQKSSTPMQNKTKIDRSPPPSSTRPSTMLFSSAKTKKVKNEKLKKYHVKMFIKRDNAARAGSMNALENATRNTRVGEI